MGSPAAQCRPVLTKTKLINVMKYRILSLLFFCVALTAAAQTEQLDSVYHAAEKAAGKQRWPEVYAHAERYIALCGSPQTTFRYTKMLSYRARQAALAGNRTESIRLGTEVVELRRKTPDCEVRHVANGLNELSVYYAQSGNYDEAIRLCGEALAIFEKSVNGKDSQYAVAMTNMAVFLSSRGDPGDYQKAVEMGERSLKNLKSGTRDYANALNNLVAYYSLTDNFMKAEELSKRALKEGRKIYGTQGADYASMLANHATRLASMRAYVPALRYAEEAEAVFRAGGGTDNLLFVKAVVNHASICAHLERYADAIALYEEALPLLRSIVGEDHADYVRCISELSTAYGAAGNSEKAEEYATQLTGRLQDQTKANAKYARALSKQADVIAATGNYARAVEVERSALDIFRRSNEPEGVALTLNKLAQLYTHTGDYAAAVDSGMVAVRLLADKPNARQLLADVLGSVAMAHYYEARFDSARTYCQWGVKLYENLADTLNSVYAKMLSNLALYNYVDGQTATAIALSERARNIQLSVLGDDHPDNVPMFYNLANYYNDLGDGARTTEYVGKALSLQTRIVRDNFSHKTSAERETFYNMKSYVFKSLPTFAYLHRNDPAILSAAYDAQLFTKGLLLNSEINFRNFLVQSGDSVLLAKYDRLELLRRDIDASYQLPPEERAERLAPAQREAAQLEKQLVKDCKEYGNFMSALDGDFRSVASALGSDEMAVEFMDLDVRGQGRTYAALYLRKGWDAPRLKVLFSRKDLEALDYGGKSFFDATRSRGGITQVYRDTLVGRLVWGELLPEMEDVRTVWFAPSGLLYQLGAEYLALDSVTNVSDRFELHRLSSTRLLADRTAARKSVRTAAVFGGLNYDMDLTDMREEHERFKEYVFEEPTDLYAERALMADSMTIDSLASRGSVNYLPGTRNEAEFIGEQLMQADIPTDLFMGNEGTEEAFKALDGRSRNIVHIATHGFYFTDEQVAASGDAARFLVREDAGGSPLSHSGLLLSGANYTLRGNALPAGMQDGVLTAREISLLDLQGADLIVLSACQTGVGEVRDDGVFGLQRGFKKAGASTLLMSLWSVNDAATMTMMNNFYAALMEGRGKYDAFRHALSRVRAEGFDDPYYWASFILLDDL